MQLASFKAVRFSPVSTLPDTSLLYVNLGSVFKVALTAIEVQRAVPGVLSITKEYFKYLEFGLLSLYLSLCVCLCVWMCVFTLFLSAMFVCS